MSVAQSLALVLVPLIAMGMMGRADAAPKTRAEYAKAFATIKPGMTGDQVKQRLGAPDDIKTARDPGGISASRTTEVWRWGTRAHLAFATLGTVHIQADGKVQYVFGGSGNPLAAPDEPGLRLILEVIDAVPSYNATLEPGHLIRAVNTLQPLGKDRALAILAEYLRVSSSLDDDGREGVFLILRTLFDVPTTGAMPPMFVGAPTLEPPKDPKILPRFPLVLVDDIPLTLVSGYMLGGHPEQPETHVAWFRQHGTLRAKPLTPPAKPLDAIAAYVDGPLAKLVTVDDSLRVLLYDQALRLIGTAYRPPNVDQGWFAHSVSGATVASRWTAIRAQIAKLGITWDAKASRFTLADGTTVAPSPTYQRVWWDLPLAGASTARVTLERITDTRVDLRWSIELARGSATKAAVLEIMQLPANTKLHDIAIAAAVAPPTSTAGSGGYMQLTLAKGTTIRLVLGTKSSPSLTP